MESRLLRRRPARQKQRPTEVRSRRSRRVARRAKHHPSSAAETGAEVQIGSSLARLHQTEADLAEELRKVADRHAAEHDAYHVCHTLAKLCDAIGHRLEPVAER